MTETTVRRIAILLLFLCIVVATVRLVSAQAFRPELVLQMGHTRPVNSVAISPDGRWLASGSQDSTVKIWDISTGRLLRTLYGGSGKINAIAISPDEQWIAAAGDDNLVRLWSTAIGNQAFVFGGHDATPGAVAFSSDSKSLISASTDGVRIHECTTGREIGAIRFKEEDRGGRTTLSPDGRLALIGGAIGTPGYFGGDLIKPYKVIELSGGKELSRIKVDIQQPFANMAFSPNGKFIAMRGGRFKDRRNQNYVKILDSNSGNEVITIQIPEEGNPQAMGAMCFSNDGRWLAVDGGVQSDLSSTLYIFDVTNGQKVRELKNSYMASSSMSTDSINLILNPLVFSANGELIAMGGSRSILLWNTKDGKELSPLRTDIKPGALQNGVAPENPENIQENMEMAEQANELMDDLNDPENEMGDYMAMAKNILGATGSNLANSPKFLTDDRLKFAAGNRWLVTEKPNRTNIWDLSSGTYLQMPFGATRPITVSPDKRLFASIEYERTDYTQTEIQSGKIPKQQIILRDTATFSIQKRIDFDQFPEEMTFGPDGSWLAVQSHTSIRILEVSTGKELRTIPLDQGSVIERAIFSPDGKYFAYGGKSMASAFPGAVVMPGMPGMQQPMSREDMMKLMKEYSKNMGKSKNPPQPEESKADQGYTVKVVDLNSGQKTATLTLKSDEQSAASKQGGAWNARPSFERHDFAFSNDGSLLAVKEMNQQLPIAAVYETATGRQTGSVRLSNSVALPTNDYFSTSEKKREPRWVFAFSPDRKTLAIGVKEGAYAVRLVNIESGQTTAVLIHSSRVDSIAFSSDGRFIATLQQDGTRMLWSSTGTQLATLVEFMGNNYFPEWLVTTPDGLFDGSPSAFSEILWRFSPSTFDVAPVEVFFNEMYYPGLLSDIWAGKVPKAPRDISQIDRRQPSVAIAKKDGAASSRNTKLQITVSEAAADASHPEGSGAQDVRLFRNGSLVRVWHGDALKGNPKAVFETEVPLVAGQNRFVAYAFSRSNIKSPDGQLTIPGDESLREPGTAHILAIGINQYSNSNFNLKFAVPDAQDFADQLKQSLAKAGTYSNTDVVLLLDDNASKENILASLQKFKGVKPEDAIFVFYAGHGTAEGARFYLVPHDIGYAGTRDQLDSAGMKTILGNSISDIDLQQSLEEIDAARILLVIDACNSGQALESEEKRRGLMNSRGLAQLAYEKGMYILAGAQSYQAALEADELGHGYLTYSLVEEGLKTPAADTSPQDGQVWVREWLDYSTMRVPQMQGAKIEQARLLQHDLTFVEGADKIQNGDQPNLQRPRVFYRREPEIVQIVIAKP